MEKEGVIGVGVVADGKPLDEGIPLVVTPLLVLKELGALVAEAVESTEVTPLSKLTTLRLMGPLEAKKSAADKEGSIEGAGG